MSKELSTEVSQNVTDVLKVPGDKLSARVTDSGRKVIKVNTEEISYSAVQYPTTGTVVETKTTRKK